MTNTPNDKGGSAGEQTNYLDTLKNKILNEGALPKRLQLIDNLIEEATMQGYKRGFKEAEAYAAESTRRELLALEERITQLQTYKMFDFADAEKLVELKDVKTELRKRISELKGGQSS